MQNNRRSKTKKKKERCEEGTVEEIKRTKREEKER